ncbi:MAG TPA: DNA repair protein RadC [Candidatus Absconditabacterales bacterium]|nr:DNA repair protein RadC [Candidatus Absconditabacterales bacterium]
MAKIKDTPMVDRPRERFLKKGPDALSKSDLLAIILGSGIKGKNVQKLAQQIIKQFSHKFLDVTVEDLQTVEGIGPAKALQIVSAISLVKRFYEENKTNEIIIKNSKDVLNLTYELRGKKKEYLICLYLNARNVLIKKETISVGLLDKSLFHPREIFYPAIELNSASIILVHNHPSGDSSPTEKDKEVVKKIVEAGELIGIPVIDFLITSENDDYSFFEELKDQNRSFDYVADGVQGTLFDYLEIEKPVYEINIEKVVEFDYYLPKIKNNYHQLQNRRYIGSKQKLINWIFSVIKQECKGKTFADIFAGTGIVGAVAIEHFEKVILNDFLFSNNSIYEAFLGNGKYDQKKINNIIRNYNNINHEDLEDNYFSENFGGKYFSQNSAKIIGFIRENIEQNRKNLTDREYNILIASLLYSIDKIANTVGHYDAYFKKDFIPDNFFMKPIEPIKANNVDIFREDTNILARKLKADVVYIDPPYNSRQYSRFYHVLENLTQWKKPKLHGTALKPDPENMSDYCTVKAKDRLRQLVNDICFKYTFNLVN